jgi:hypothetical protein
MAKVCAHPEEIVKDFRKSFGVSAFRSTGEAGVPKLIRGRGAGAWSARVGYRYRRRMCVIIRGHPCAR